MPRNSSLGPTSRIDLSVGMSDEELERICGESDVDRGPAPWIYWVSEAYGFGGALREFARFPSWLPLAVCADHSGPKFTDELSVYELNSRAPFYLSHSEARARRYKELTGRNAVVIASPAVLHRRRRAIERDRSARGTIAFPTHRAPVHRVAFSAEEYARNLESLPSEYHPVAVSLHMHDIRVGVHRDYRELGIPVVSAGNPHDRKFLDRLYSLFSSCSAVTSDQPCTAMFLALEMGIPFFIHGQPAEIFDLAMEGESVASGLPDSTAFDFFASELSFENAGKRDQARARALAEDMLGLRTGVTSARLARILWWSLFAWLSDPVNLKDAAMYLVSGGRRIPDRNR